MSPFRLLVLAALGYILYRLLTGREQTGQASGQARQRSDDGLVADDVLVEDPVCHTYIPQQGAETLTVAGQTYYFCGPECRKRYQSETRR